MLRLVRPVIVVAALAALSACSTTAPTGPSNPAAATPVSISTQPQSQTISSGSSATMTVAGNGGSLTYQWYVGSSGTTSASIAGATGASYTTPALTETTSYWVRLTGSGSAADSTTATITVMAPAAPAAPPAVAPSITEQPEHQTILTGQTATLTIETTGTAPLTYQWYVGQAGTTSAPIAGSATTSYTTPVLTATTSYWVRVSNAAGTVDSRTATITVTTSPPPSNPAPPANPQPPNPTPPPNNPTPPPGNPTPPAPTPPAPTPPAPTPPAENAGFEDQVLALVNQHRATGATCGGTAYPAVPALTMNASLRMAARSHSADMAVLNYFSHTSLDGRTFSQRMSNAGYSGAFPWGENIAAGQPSPQSVVNAWMASPGHCTNIMNGSYRVIGVGYAFLSTSQYRHYWTQDFGGS